MKIEEQYPRINVVFGFDGREGELINFSEISDALDISPSETRTPDDWPEALKRQAPYLPEEIRPRSTWDIETEYEVSYSVSEVFEKLLYQLRGKEQIIRTLSQNMKLMVSIGVGIHMKETDGPEMVLTSEIIAFAAAINAEIGFDIYSYSDYAEELKEENIALKKELEELKRETLN